MKTQKGILESWTRIERPPTGFTAPLVVALVRLDDGGRTFAAVAPEAELEIGQSVRVRAETDGRVTLRSDGGRKDRT